MSITRLPPPFRHLGQKYAFVVVAVIFFSLLVSAGLRSTPSVLIVPLEQAFGWSRSTISLAAAIGIFLYGLAGPFAAAAMEHFGLRRVLIGALLLMAASSAASAFMTESWHLLLTWGVFSGIGSGAVAVVLGATIVNRWFTTRRGLMMGLLTASTATGNLLFLPVLAALAASGDWTRVVWAVAAGAALMAPLAWWLVPDRPADVGLRSYGSAPDAPEPSVAPRTGLLAATFGALRRAARTRTFWYLFATFFVCGFTTNGLVGTHLIALCGDHGIAEVQAAGLLALMGIFDLVGTTASGWLTDRYDPRRLLFVYYSLRGLSLMYLPYSDFSFYSLSLFAIFFGLDWIATVPPTLRLTTEAFGDRDAPIVFGWIVAGHQLGAASAAWMGGVVRETTGSYLMAFVLAGSTGLIAAVIALMINRKPRPTALAEA
ncbi:membrane transport protein [Bordetella pertussis]|uniref:Membrane transport protein n=39 Tax=Bordetella TaxID=517 RepID=Q7VVD4_BORPE|nr:MULTISPECIES: MFS transporter [Bordetella]ETH39803.1 transporter, major facilitator family protein [Bordetella pertussis H918]ETH42278.1 transporter, major facilitator family protein [Bordetella pertussis H939]ETH46251.1 transporter, major facilitator family protein [Bordetella pertussis H921]ETH71428.1 transporter, major facilitator family protein [Bordetella pertussis STO1-CHLA-0011]ETH84245.1 transporter, major facilitator family protein [Bordetella pertussis STO1-CHOC-0017]ETH88384.1 t